MRIVFFGTPQFAVPSLTALLREGHAVAGVVTRPDKPQGRSRSTLVPPPVKVIARRKGIRVLQPARPVGDLFLAGLRHLEPELGVVVAYGHILRPEVLAIPPMGMINVHASLLPRHRGAAPIQHAILAGDRESGVSVMQMTEGLDSGPVFHRISTPIEPGEPAGSLADRLADLGATALIETLSLLAAGQARPVPQDPAEATCAPKLSRETARLDWRQAAEIVARQVRAFDPAPGAWTTHRGTPLKLFGGAAVPGQGEPGTVLAAEERLVLACGRDAVEIREVQPAGRARLPVGAWVRGRGIITGERLQ